MKKVLDWNVNAKKCYDKQGGRDLTVEKDYHIYRFDYDQLVKMANEAKDI